MQGALVEGVRAMWCVHGDTMRSCMVGFASIAEGDVAVCDLFLQCLRDAIVAKHMHASMKACACNVALHVGHELGRLPCSKTAANFLLHAASTS